MEPPSTPSITVTGETIAAERDWLRDAAETYVELINRSRRRLGRQFDEDVGTVTTAQFQQEVDAVFSSSARAANVAGLMQLSRAVDVAADFPGFVVDERLGRWLASTIAGGEPRATLAAATFHFIDISHDVPGESAGRDDMDAGIAAGFQTRLPGWDWQSSPPPFDDDLME